MITQTEVLRLFSYRDGKLFWRVKIARKIVVGNEAGTFRQSDGYRQIMVNGTTYRTHRLVFLYHHGFMPDLVDHIDRDPTNNHIENLREASKSENTCNSKLRRDNTSGVKGVAWDKAKRKWVAKLYANNRCVNLGRFAIFDDAVRAITNAYSKHHGNFVGERFTS